MVLNLLTADYSSLMLHRKNLNDQQPKVTEEQKFQCAVCGKMYSSWVQLVQHSRVHLGQYKCPLCDHSFNRQSNLVAHIKRHRMEQGFTCRVCLETFSNRGELIFHRRWVIQLLPEEIMLVHWFVQQQK